MARYLVVGGAGGVGSSLVDSLKAAGHTLIVSVLNDREMAAVEAAHADVAHFQLDLSKPYTVVGTIKNALGDELLDGVAVCAAFAPIGILETSDLSQIGKTFDINVVSALAIFQAAMPKLRESKGRLVFISSMAGKVSMPFVGSYSAAKFGLEGLADAMRREVAHQGVKVVIVEPGGIVTPMVDAQISEVGTMIDALSEEENRLYGSFYRGFRDAATHSHTKTASTAVQVAAVVEQALTDADPSPRYIAGSDAEQLIGASRVMTDTQIDEMMAGIMLGEGAAA